MMYSTELLIQTLISGVMIGVLYALMALGITFIYSIVRMINWAMGEFYMLGSYIQYVAVAYALGRNYWWLAILISTAGTFLIGYLLEPILIKPMHVRPMERRDDYATVVTIALLLMLRSLAVAIGGPYQFRPETNLPIMWVGPLPMEGARVAASVFALVALAVFYLVISRTWIGLALRAMAQNRVAAQTSGVDVFRFDAIAFAIGVALAGLAGALLAPLFLVYPTNGAVTTVKGFEIIVIGGLGSIPGALIGGVLLGVVESLGAAFISSPYQNAYGFAAGAADTAGAPLRPVRRTRTGSVSDVLATAGLTKRYGGLMANDGVAIALAAGEIRGLIGPNGAGKTTFVNLVTGIERPDEGEILLDGSAITGLGPHRIAARGLVRSFQVARVFGNLTVRENLMVPYFASARTSGTAEAIARISELLQLSTLEPLARRPRQIALRRPTHAAAGLRRIHDSGREGSCARRAVRRHQSGGQGHVDRADPARRTAPAPRS